ncbi:condensation domain-containing protein, partial [uncultured Aquimarina sp.]|uniref:condensation domain-containing protein n=1 Tax=uncultured Aquimarina sp. TaxID=575652 RepID=UPI0026365F5F
MGYSLVKRRKLPISEYQKRFFLEWALAPKEIIYNNSFVKRIVGNLNKEILKEACDTFVKRTEIVQAQYSKNGQSCYFGNFSIDDFYKELTFNKNDTIESQIKELLYKPFDLTKGPLLRLYLIKNHNNEEEFYFFFVAHHIICDATWVFQFFNQIQNFYKILFNKGEISLDVNNTFTQAVEVEQSVLNSNYKEKAEKFWLDFINDISLKADLPYRSDTDIIHQDNILADKTGGFIYFDLSSSQTRSLREYAQQRGTTVFITLSALYALIISKYLNQEKFFFSYAVNARAREFIEVPGCFVNNIPMKLEFDLVNTLDDLIKMIGEQRKTVKPYQIYSFTDIIHDQRKYMHRETNDVFNIGFSQSYLNNIPFELQDVTVSSVDISWSKNSIHEIGLLYDEYLSDAIKFKIEYRKLLFEENLIKQIVLSFKNVIHDLTVSGKEILLKNYSVLTPESYNRLVYEWNDTYRAYPTDRTLYDLFELQVERTPDSIALVYEDRSLTYSELNDLSNALAYYIRDEYSARVG